MPSNPTKADATRWGSRVGWEHFKEAVQPALRQWPPMAVQGGRGDTFEVARDLTLDQVRLVVCSSGKCAGMEYLGGGAGPPRVLSRVLRFGSTF